MSFAIGAHGEHSCRVGEAPCQTPGARALSEALLEEQSTEQFLSLNQGSRSRLIYRAQAFPPKVGVPSGIQQVIPGCSQRTGADSTARLSRVNLNRHGCVGFQPEEEKGCFPGVGERCSGPGLLWSILNAAKRKPSIFADRLGLGFAGLGFAGLGAAACAGAQDQPGPSQSPVTPSRSELPTGAAAARLLSWGEEGLRGSRAAPALPCWRGAFLSTQDCGSRLAAQVSVCGFQLSCRVGDVVPWLALVRERAVEVLQREVSWVTLSPVYPGAVRLLLPQGSSRWALVCVGPVGALRELGLG